MKRLQTIVTSSLLGLVILSTACGPVEWGETYIWGHGYTVHFKLPKPFKESEGYVELETHRTPYEHGYVTDGEEKKFQVRVMEMPVGAWMMDGYNRQAIVELGLSRGNPNTSDKILDRQDFIDPDWPEHVNPAEELTIESADGKTVRHTRVLIYESTETYWCYVVLTAVRPKTEPRSVDVDKFFNSLRICTGDKRPGRC